MRLSSSIVRITAVLGTLALDLITAKSVLNEDPILRYLSTRTRNSRVGRRSASPAHQIPPRSSNPSLQPRAPIPQGPDEPTDVPTDSPASFDQQAFNVSATASCSQALGSLQSVVNPSGMAGCYNVPFFDSDTGTFVADIRLYQVSNATGEFEGVPSDSFTLEVMIPQGTLSAPRHFKGSGGGGEEEGLGMLHEFQHVGQLNSEIEVDKLTLDDLQVLLIPNITMSARTTPPEGEPSQIATTLSSDTLSYLTGLFTANASSTDLFTPTLQDPPPPDASSPAVGAAAAEAAVNITVPDAAARAPDIVSRATAFVLPGTMVEVFPLGMILVGGWTAVFVCVVGWGTVERWRFREHYRQRVQRAGTTGMGKG